MSDEQARAEDARSAVAVDAKGKVAEHSPGPWVARPSSDGECFADINAPNWFGFARVVIRMEDDESDHPAGLANLRLFLAAPDLLEACKAAEEWLNGWMSAEPYIDIIRAAIAKAEEETK